LATYKIINSSQTAAASRLMASPMDGVTFQTFAANRQPPASPVNPRTIPKKAAGTKVLVSFAMYSFSRPSRLMHIENMSHSVPIVHFFARATHENLKRG
jgi:hypothetical protein